VSRNRDVVSSILLLVGACLLVVAGVGLVGGTTATGTSNHTSPSLDVTLDGDRITDGDARIVREQPRLGLDASVSGSNATVETVVVTVDGETVYERDDADGPVRLHRPLPLGGGNNTVRILAEGTDEVATSVRFRVYLETVPPSLRLTEPNPTPASAYFFPDITVNRTRITLAGAFRDVTGVDEATIAHERPGVTGTYDSFRVEGPDARFSRPLLLYDGRNRIEVTTRDVLDNRYTGSFDVRVVDREAPELSLDYRASTESTPRYAVSGSVTDNVWVSNATISVLHYNNGPYEPRDRSYRVVPDRNYRRGTARLNVSFEQRIRLLEGENYVSVTAHDRHGNNVTSGYWIRYSPNTSRPPSIGLDWNRTEVRDDETLVANALVTDDDRDLERVRVTVTNLDTGRATDVESIYPERNDTYLLDRPLTIGPGVNRVDIRAFDSTGNDTQLLFFANTATENVSQSQPATADGTNETTDTGTATDPATPGGTETDQPTATVGDDDGGFVSLPAAPSLPTLGGGFVLVAGVGYLWYRRVTRV